MEESQNSKNKRIAKNTIYLYVRTFIVMLISLYTSRVILKALGETDFGIYNLVGGVVVFFTFINSAMVASTQRFLNYEVGRGNASKITEIFSTSVYIHILISIVILLLGETVGLWFVISKLNIPEGREHATFWVYQLCLITTCITTIRCPYNASIIAFEKMVFFAKISIVEAILKLAVAYCILLSSEGRLIVYALLLLLSSLIVNLIYVVYCKKNFTDIRLKLKISKSTIKAMLGFSMWSLLGNGAIILSNQGVTMLLNIAYNVLVNAALGIAYQVNAAATTLVSNFQTAFMPQITKSYASNDIDYFIRLIVNTSRYSFLLFFIVSFPIFFNCRAILDFWLGEYPAFTVGIVRIIIICVGFDALSGPLWMAVHSKGEIRNYQIIISLLLISTILFSYIAIRMGANPVVAFGSRIIVLAIIYIFRLIYVKIKISFPIRNYIIHTVIPVIAVLTVSICAGIAIHTYILNVFIQLIIDFIVVSFSTYFLGLVQSERKSIMDKIAVKFR